MDVEPTTDLESIGLTFYWDDWGPPTCTNGGFVAWPGTHHLEIWRTEGATPPTAPGDGVRVHNPSASYGDYVDLVHRSAKTYSYQLFTCANAGCTRFYGDGDGGPAEAPETHIDTATTENEVWELQNIYGETDVGHGVVSKFGAQAPFVWFYPAMWETGLANRLAIYYSIDQPDSTSGRSQLYIKQYSAAGWPVGGYNDGAWDTASVVGEGSRDTADPGEDHSATYPWAMRVQDGATQQMLVFLRTRYVDDGIDLPEQIISFRTSDAAGATLDVACDTGASDTGCGLSFADAPEFRVDIVPGVTDGATEIESVRSGRFVWDYIADPIYNLGVDSPPSMWVNVTRPGLGEGVDEECEDPAGNDDVANALPSWDTDHFEWALQVETTEPYCPVIVIDDYRITTIMPLPGGQAKAYVQEYDFAPHQVIYWNGYAWENPADVEFAWDLTGSGGGPTHKCVEGPNHVVRIDAGVPRQALFFRVIDSDTCETMGTYSAPEVGFDLDTGDPEDGDDSEIVFARLVNG